VSNSKLNNQNLQISFIKYIRNIRKLDFVIKSNNLSENLTQTLIKKSI
jgi:hypothetical protein